MQANAEKDYTQKFDLGLWKRIFRAVREVRGDFVRLAVCMALCAVGDVLFPLLSARAIDGFIAIRSTEGVGLFIVEYVALIVV